MAFGYEARYTILLKKSLYKTIATDMPEAIRKMRSLLFLVVTQLYIVEVCYYVVGVM